jgi:tRNA/rRNA methyltransferase
VAISCYELTQFSNSHSLETNTDDNELASLEVVEAYYKQLESLLLSIEYLYPPTASSRMEKIRQLYNRAQLQTQEVAMLRGILRQMQWALTQSGNS